MKLTDLGKRIRETREALHLTQQQLAHSLGITAQAVSKWECGDNAPDISCLMDLSRLLGIQLDWLLSDGHQEEDTFDATVFVSTVRGFADIAVSLSPKDATLKLNTYFQAITEMILDFQGVPVKYIGDGFLAYFSGALHQQRAIDTGIKMLTIFSDIELLMTLDAGPIYLGSVGYGDYARPDIISNVVNDVFLLNNWANQHSDSKLLATDLVYDTVVCEINADIRHDTILGKHRSVYEIG